MRGFLIFLALLALAAGGWFAYSRFMSGPPAVWVDFGSLLRLPPDAEVLYLYDRPGGCYRGEGAFVTVVGFSSFNTQLRHTAPVPRLVLYARNDAGDIVALAAQDPTTKFALQVNYGRPGFVGLKGRVWSDTGKATGAGLALTRLPVAVTSGRLRVNARAVTCPENLPK